MVKLAAELFRLLVSRVVVPFDLAATVGLENGCLAAADPPTIADAEAGIRGGGMLSDLIWGIGAAAAAAPLSAASPEPLDFSRLHDRLSFLRKDVLEEGLRGSGPSDSCGSGGGDFVKGLDLCRYRGPAGFS